MTKKFARAMGLAKDEADEFLGIGGIWPIDGALERNRFFKNLADIRLRHQLKTGAIKAEDLGKSSELGDLGDLCDG